MSGAHDKVAAGGMRSMSRDHLRQLLLVTWVGLAVNVALLVLKFAAGVIGRSQAVVADAFHTFSDVSTDVALLLGVRYWSAPADESHAHGHRRIETVVAVFISVVLATVAAGLIHKALVTLKEEHLSAPRWIAFAAAAGSVVIKEAMYRWTAVVGRRIGSSAMVANAWHHRSDAFAAIPASLAVLGARIIPAWAFLDHVGAVVVSLIILWAAWQIGWPAMKELVDASAPEKTRRQIEAIALATDGVKTAHAIRTRYVGSRLAVDLHITVDKAVSVGEGHSISEAVTRRLLSQGPDVLDVVVHLEPYEAAEEPTQEF